MATLYDIDNRIRAALAAAIDPETGELKDAEALEALDQLEMERTEKCENIACFWKDLTAQAAAIKAEEKALKERRESIEKKAERLKDYLAYALAGEKLNTARVAVSYRTSKQVQADLAEIPKKYIRKKVTEEPDKKAIKEALEAGKKVKGAELIEKINLQIK